MESQKFIDTRTGEILTVIPISEIAFFEKYEGPLKAGEKQELKPSEAQPEKV